VSINHATLESVALGVRNYIVLEGNVFAKTFDFEEHRIFGCLAVQVLEYHGCCYGGNLVEVGVGIRIVFVQQETSQNPGIGSAERVSTNSECVVSDLLLEVRADCSLRLQHRIVETCMVVIGSGRAILQGISDPGRNEVHVNHHVKQVFCPHKYKIFLVRPLEYSLLQVYFIT